MIFESRHIVGAGRGKGLGYPTINLTIPEHFELEYGIYAVKILIGGKHYPGAMHYGPIPSFDDPNNSLEVNVIEPDFIFTNELIDELITVEIIQRIRDVKKFNSPEELKSQIAQDISSIKAILGLP